MGTGRRKMFKQQLDNAIEAYEVQEKRKNGAKDDLEKAYTAYQKNRADIQSVEKKLGGDARVLDLLRGRLAIAQADEQFLDLLSSLQYSREKLGADFLEKEEEEHTAIIGLATAKKNLLKTRDDLETYIQKKTEKKKELSAAEYKEWKKTVSQYSIKNI